MSTETTTPTPMVRGQKWRIDINGKNSLNGKRHGVVLFGDVERMDDDSSIYSLMRVLAQIAQDQNKEMLFPDSFQITLFPEREP